MDLFDFSGGLGQRSETFRFDRREGSSLRPLGTVAPLLGATLNQSGYRSLQRTLSFNLDEEDSAQVNFVSDRIDLFMELGDQSWPLGRYLFTSATQQDYLDVASDEIRSLTACTLADQMSVVDVEMQTGFVAVLEPARASIERLLEDLPIEIQVEDSGYLLSNSWLAGTSRRSVLEAIAELSGYLPPWFDNNGVLQVRQQFDPTDGVAEFDLDQTQSVFRDSVTRVDSTIYAPNRIIVVSNGGNVYGGTSSEKNPVDPIDPGPLTAFCDVPSTAPHSAMNLGFIRPQVVEIQATSQAQCQAVADLLCLTQTAVEEIELSTAIDPRQDGWNTVQFQGKRWLQTNWSATLVAGGAMRHAMQRSYPPSPEVLSGTAGQVAVDG